jgi:protein farnesyltransferase subunit beta
MEASEWLLEVKWTYGKFKSHMQPSMNILSSLRGAYCAAVIITLLDLPLELSRESPAWSREGMTLLTGLPEYVSRCK